MRALVISALLTVFSGAVTADNVYRFKMPKNIYDTGLPKNCASLLAQKPSQPSGDITIFPQGLNGPAIEVFCDMTTDGGGWTRILSVGVGKKRCFGEFNLNPEGYCVKSSRQLSLSVNTMGIPYTEIRGGVSAYQSGSNDGFRRYVGGRTINDTYVDGISFTYNNQQGIRQHLFTYAIGQSQAGNQQSCPNVGGVVPPAFVGTNFYCESGNPNAGYTFEFYDEPLFSDYEFKSVIQNGTATSLEVRVMNDQVVSDENIALNRIYIFIR